MHVITIEYRKTVLGYLWCVCEYYNSGLVKICTTVPGYYLGIAGAKAYASAYGAEFVA
jgi:hypothetical protein